MLLSRLIGEGFSYQLCCDSGFGLDKFFLQFAVLCHIFWIGIQHHAFDNSSGGLLAS